MSDSNISQGYDVCFDFLGLCFHDFLDMHEGWFAIFSPCSNRDGHRSEHWFDFFRCYASYDLDMHDAWFFIIFHLVPIEMVTGLTTDSIFLGLWYPGIDHWFAMHDVWLTSQLGIRCLISELVLNPKNIRMHDVCLNHWILQMVIRMFYNWSFCYE
jgi:hypothetical protein